ncbi:hypothetical protein BDV95DRAFT_485732 [Massariosphaeria phaeospora]|uniref:Protein transport protein SEC9 n=1 Tax=Massariosphaeria phaeospora TaxID=100035 RepID=A0A7C8IAF3_9PLEO|nr:hypothetical protein BDV95DRAFT_485732 [Massariosphaeria phaeospora]
MGFLKKKTDDGEDSSRSALFGSRNKAKAAPPAQNPYAAPPPAADPYQNAPPPYQGGGGNDQWRRDKTPAATGYGAQGGAYGGTGGYGGDRYGGDQQPQGTRRPGGYGDPNNDSARQDLFGAAPKRYEQQAQPPQAPSGASGAYGQGGYGQSGAYGADQNQAGYGTYEDRQLTQEEQEEEDVNATRQEIKFIKQQDVSSTRNALRLAEQAEQTGRDTLARLGAQGERIHNTERNLDLSASQNRIAEEKARELKTLNKSMFAMHVGNPFTSASRRDERDRKLLDTHRQERDARDASRQAAWESSARSDGAKQGQQGAGRGGPSKSTLADRAKYQFEADSDDDAMEGEIDSNLDQLQGAAQRLNRLGRAMGEEVEVQNRHIDRITTKTDKVDDQIAMNRARLDRIH